LRLKERVERDEEGCPGPEEAWKDEDDALREREASVAAAVHVAIQNPPSTRQIYIIYIYIYIYLFRVLYIYIRERERVAMGSDVYVADLCPGEKKDSNIQSSLEVHTQQIPLDNIYTHPPLRPLLIHNQCSRRLSEP